jgi:hypothetical protein
MKYSMSSLTKLCAESTEKLSFEEDQEPFNNCFIPMTAINAIPKIVCDALKTLELVNCPPTWSIKDEKGNVTVVLNWDQRDRYKKGGDYAEPSSWRVEVLTSQPSDAQYSSQAIPLSSTASTSRAKVSLDGLKQRPITRTLPFRTLSTEDEDDDFERIEQLSPSADLDHDHSLCDFHCAALHRGGGQISVRLVYTNSFTCLSHTLLYPII